MAVKKESIRMCKGHKSPLLNCIGDRKESDFYTCWSDFTDGKTLYCKNCCDKMFKYFIDNGCSEKMALYYTLMKIDQPFIKEIYESTLEKKNKFGNLVGVSVGSYLTELHKSSAKKEIWKDFSCTDVNNIVEFDTKVASIEEKKERLNKLEKDWGKQDTIEDYEFLEETFDRYTSDRDELDPRQIDLFRDLCRDRLLLRKINDGRYGGEESIDKVQARVSKLMGTLKIDQFEQKKKKTDIEKILEKQIWEIENTEPAEVIDKNEYADFLDIKKSWGQDILRCVKNLLVSSKEYPNITRDSDKY